METIIETPINQTGCMAGTPAPAASHENIRHAISPASQPPAPAPSPTCSGASGSEAHTYIYALGRVEPRFPSPGVEKEFAQATGRGQTKGKTDREALHSVLSSPENRYLARQLCWVLTIQGLETYLLVPRDSMELDLLVETVRPNPRPTDLDVVIGVRGPIASPKMCNGLMIPMVALDQVYSFDRKELIESIPRPEKVAAKEFQPAAEELFERIMQLTDNAGATDENRALNYLAVRYPAIYAKVAEQFAENASLSAVETRRSPLSATQKIMDVVFHFKGRETDVEEKFLVRVDVTERFPFLVTKLSPYYDR